MVASKREAEEVESHDDAANKRPKHEESNGKVCALDDSTTGEEPLPALEDGSKVSDSDPKVVATEATEEEESKKPAAEAKTVDDEQPPINAEDVEQSSTKEKAPIITMSSVKDIAYNEEAFEEGGVLQLSFPERLMELLQGGQVNKAMNWLPDGHAFYIAPKVFFNVVLEEHFYGTKYESFTRKLNRWGFKRFTGNTVPQNCIAYRNASFKRDQPELLKDMHSGAHRHYMPPVEPAAKIIFSQRNLQQNLSAATSSNITSQHGHFSAAGLQHHDASGLMSMGAGLFSGGNAQSPMDVAMYYNTTFGNAGMFGPGGGGLASSLAPATQPGSGTAGLYDNTNSEPSNALHRLISQQTQSTSSGDGGGGAVDHQALAYEQMLANQQRGASSLEAEFHFQQLWDQQQQRINSSNMGHGGNGGAGLVGIPGGLPTDNPENPELVRLLLMRDQLERQKNGEV